jgi:hypothetical protein
MRMEIILKIRGEKMEDLLAAGVGDDEDGEHLGLDLKELPDGLDELLAGHAQKGVCNARWKHNR